ncbi:MAG TPA: adenylate/guanylate cyclase domain-containing protein [Nitrospiraceae bacterium]|nr:adenylate/guanylate cyclase domain-containing protein [Nitrospiraceae bacterium]
MALEPKKIKKIIILSAISFAISLVLYLSGLLNVFELKAFDLFSKLLNPSKSSGDIVIVQVDQQSIDNLSKEGINWPWPRQMYAPMLEYMSEADAVFIDILYTEPSSYGEDDDRIFAKAIKDASNVYLALFLTNKKRELSAKDEEFIKKISIKDDIKPGLRFSSAITPIDIIKSSAKGAGNVTIPPDEDGVYRKIPLVFKMGDYTIPHFILNHLIQKGSVIFKNGSIFAGNTEIPLSKDKMILRYYRTDNSFPAICAVDVIKSYLDSSESKEPLIKKEYFKGKKVFIGLTAAGLYDLKPTSISSISTGVMIHAATIDNILNKSFFRPIAVVYVILFMLFICIFISYAVLRQSSVYVNLSTFFLSFAVTLFIPAMLFKSAYYMHILYPAASLIISFLAATVYSYATEGKERRFVRRAFSQYMDETIVDYILKNPDVIKPGGRRKRVTVFFTDIAGFTTISESLPVEETAKILHTVLNEFTEVIIKDKGVIDKYIGDAIMAFWGAPLDTERDEINACYAALHCIEALSKINRRFKAEGMSEINMRVGINSGDAIVGNLGSDRLFDYTVVGDTVNLASRLEGANKVFRTKIIISESTLEKTGNIFFTRALGLIEVKGKTKPVRIFELVAENEKMEENKKEAVRLYNQGLELFKNSRFNDARDIFEGILKRFPDDGPSEFYKKRCMQAIENAQLTEKWDIIKLTEK